MKEYNYTIEQFRKLAKNYAIDVCPDCGGIREVNLEEIRINVENKSMEFIDFPMLKCKSCGGLTFTLYSLKIMYECFNELKNKGCAGVKCNPSGYRKVFDFCKNTGFIYDHRDYESIPGLMTELSHAGFLQPVYFKKEALLYFMNSPDYETNIFSESYGELSKIDKSGDYPFEWSIPFGFNTNNLLIFWLGDLEKTDDECRAILKGFNILSDHLLIDSDYYRAQLKVIWSNPIKEQQIILNKKSFMNNVEKRYGVRLNHLDEECDSYAKKVVRPVVYTEKTLSETFNALHKVLIEGLNSEKLRLLYEKIYLPDERDKKYREWKQINLIQGIINKLDSRTNKDVRELIGPLYVLNDLRIIFDHLLRKKDLEERKQNVVRTLNASGFTEYEYIYKEEISGLDRFFQYLVLITK